MTRGERSLKKSCERKRVFFFSFSKVYFSYVIKAHVRIVHSNQTIATRSEKEEKP
jgi:hypothetical protein